MATSHSTRDSRCLCGNLLARLRSEGVELKCRRCKRVMVIPWGDPTTWHGITIQWQQPADEKTERQSLNFPHKQPKTHSFSAKSHEHSAS